MRLSRSTQSAAALLDWRLALAAAAAVVLSIASGWTTWDGMKNFTGEPILSFLITFGIQGIMLLAAWLIGDSFLEQGDFLIRGKAPAQSPASSIAVISGITLCAGVLLLTVSAASFYVGADRRPDFISLLSSVFGWLGLVVGLALVFASILIAFSRV